MFVCGIEQSHNCKGEAALAICMEEAYKQNGNIEIKRILACLIGSFYSRRNAIIIAFKKKKVRSTAFRRKVMDNTDSGFKPGLPTKYFLECYRLSFAALHVEMLS